MRDKEKDRRIYWIIAFSIIGFATCNEDFTAYVAVHTYDRNEHQSIDPRYENDEKGSDYHYDSNYNPWRNYSHIDDRMYQYFAGSMTGPGSSDYYAELSAGQTERGLFPNIFNLASNSIISVNGTCGQRGPESFCKLVEHVYNRQPQCDICDDLNPSKRHPIEYAVDGTNRWWQSPSLATGLQYEWITITLDLRQQYQVAYVVLKSAIAPRPGNWILERSLDGVTYRPWQYYSMSDEECDRLYGIPGSRGIPKFTRDDQVICTTLYSRLDPLENGEIHTSLVNGRPGVDGPSELLQDFTKARYVRFRFQRIRTLNSDLIYVTHGHIDQSVTRRYYYAISDISIGGQCICYGHAEHCPVDPTTGQMRCECKHNTTGESCKECLPLYNQKPWRSGTVTNPNPCEPCQCFNHADRCEYDAEVEKQRLSLTPDGIYDGGGVCVNCRDNTVGINCQECKQNYYRPSGVSAYSPDACRPCQCDPTGSLDGSCVKDETVASDGLRAGDCYCKPGFGGPRCDRCDIGFKNYPTCEPCPCNRAGSANYAYCGDTCVCKKNVEGTFCDRCKAGTFNLDEGNPDGCTPCFCFGVTDQCRELDWGKIEIRDLRDWQLTNMEGSTTVAPPVNATSDIALTLHIREVPDRTLFYWKAPQSYIGSLLTSYGGYLSYFVYYVADIAGSTVPLPDVVLKGESSSLEYYSRQEFRERENVSVRIRFHESTSWYDTRTRKPADKLQLMSVLASVKALMIRSTYHQHQVQASIYGISLASASRTNDALKEKMSSVEHCVCPTTYTGLSCESCLEGYRRVNNVLYGGKCELCVCHGHSTSCDPYTGHCLDCAHNTTGPRCEHCQRGYYGAPILGGDTVGSCHQCGCPLTDPSNNFSPTCTSQKLGVSAVESDYVCTACQPGYVGNKCEMCADGYFGDPTGLGSTCQPCSCSGNIDPAAVGNCDRTTGKCLKCIGNTAGDQCELCKPEYYGDALKHDCRACGCNAYGAVNPFCNNRTGECECKSHYIGVQCDRCEEGHGDIENGCPLCQCNGTGSHSDRCDPLSGQCQCKPGVFGKRCDTCLTGYFGFSSSGCQFCGCYSLGAIENGKCDTITGQCMCRPHVQGQKCTFCEDGYYNISSGEGCQSCECHPEGSESNICDQASGQCRCKQGVTGLRCDKCAPNYYGLSSDGCKKCPICPAAGHVCDPVTGQCVCPPHTIGEMCESCAPDTWNYHPLKGCELCQCNSGGSAGASCDLVTGACVCRDGYTGRKCDQCTHGHFGFPACRRCRCFEAGTDPGSCYPDHRGCKCDNEGQCPCKKNVRGHKCKDCTPTSFSLEAGNPNGCTECFCFNRTNFCIQSSYVWQQINAPNRLALFVQPWQYYDRLHGLHVFPVEPPTLNSYPTDHTPIYWSLPGPFIGDKITSYNGYLRFQVSNQNGNYLEGPARPDERYFDYYPMVVLIGNHRVILEHYKSRADITDSGTYLVKLREDQWKARHHKEIPVTRQMMMVALQNVQAIYVRGTFIERPGEASLSGISLDAGVWDNSTASAFSNYTATGVEACDCPMGYAGISCQNPAEGYCRKKKPNYLDSEDILDLVGSAELCSCHGHSRTCERETCKCTNCDHDTTGDYCEHCIAGYYGDATGGTPSDCKKCACPLVDNSFSPTCRIAPLEPSGKGYICDSCQPGYTGAHCESCSQGYYGDPMTGGTCKPCSCNRDGSLSELCDRLSGQCQCRAGVTGRDCSECRPRHALMGRECQSCDVGCTRDLMTDVDELERIINSYNYTGLVPAPWGRLALIENRTVAMEMRLKDIKKGEMEARDLLSTLGDPRQPLTNAENVRKEVDFIKERIEKLNEKMQSIPAEAEKLTGDVYRTFTKAREVVRLLERYVSEGGLGPSIPPYVVTRWLEEAALLLNEMQNRTEYLEKRFNRAELELSRAKELLNEVMKQTFNDTAFEDLGRRVENLTKTLDEARSIVWDTIRHRLNLVDNVTSIDKKMISQYEEYMTKIKELNATAADVAHDAKDKVQGAKMHLLNIHDDYTEANFTLIQKIENLTIDCEMLANQLANLLPEYQREWVDPAISYAALLESNAVYINNSFVTTRNASHWALKAAQAYQEITEALHNASQAANAAKDASIRIFDETSGGTIVASAEASLTRSQELLEQARKLDVAGLHDSLKQQNMTLGDIDDQLNTNKKEHYEATKRFDQFDTMNDRVQAATEQAKRIQAQAQDAERKTKEIVQNINDLNVKVQELVTSAGKGILNITERVKESLDGVQKARQSLEKVGVQAAENDDKMDDLTKKLLLLKEKIAVARGKASKIKLSVKSKEDGVCMRSYLSPAMPGPVNKIHLEYKPTSDVRNASIFVTQTEQSRTRQSEYMAVELRGQRIVFLWNVGGGDRMVTNLMRIDPIPEKALKTWYHIDIERKGNAATLNVSLVPNGKPPLAVNSISYDGGGGDSVVFNTIPGSTLITLGTPLSSASTSGSGISRMTRYRVPLEGSPIHFYGNVGDIVFDNTKLALWNFIHDSGHCLASFAEVDEPVTGLSKSFLFDDGFAQVPASPYGYDSKSSNIQIVFATYSENGLVYFRGNPVDKDFVSIELAEGQIVFQFYLGGNSRLRLTSRDAYNDGRFHTVVARRYLTNGSLSVDGEEDFVTQLTPGQLVDLNVRSSEHYVGGVPLSFNKNIWSQYGINWEGFYGCIVKLTPGQGDELDIGTAIQSLNVKPNCIQQNDRFVLSNRPISFSGDGYFVVSGLQLDPVSVLSFGFRTAAPEGLLVYQSSRLSTRRRRATFGKGFYSVYLEGGRVFARVGQGDGEHIVLQTATTSYNDGRWHTIVLKRNFAEIGLHVDDVLGQTANLKQGDEAIVSGEGQLFMGGVGRGTYPNDELPAYYAYSGCISDVFLNYERINLLPQKQDNAYLGQCNSTLYQVTQTGGVLAEEPTEDGLVADGSFSARQWDDVWTSHRRISKYLFEVPVPMEEQERRRLLAHADAAAPPIRETTPTEGTESTSSQWTTPTTTTTSTTTLSPVPVTCAPTSFHNPIPAGGLYGVLGDSFNRFRLPRDFDTSDLSFWIEFRTDQPNGVLLAWPNKNWQNYLLIQLENGTVVLRTKSSRMKVEVSGSSRPNVYLADSHWHTISVIKKQRQISMEIDGHDNQIIKGAPEKPNLKLKGGLVIGGVPRSLARSTNRSQAAFVGCIRNFSINNEVQKLVGVKGQRGVLPCYEQQPAGLYLPGDGFAKFDKGTELGLSIAELEFRSDNTSDGVLMVASIPNVEIGYFSIELHNGQIAVVIKPPGDGTDNPISILEGHSPGGLCDDAWHRVRVEIIGLKFSLRVDNETTRIGSLNKEILSLLFGVPVYFGGLETTTTNQESFPLPSKSFKGCLRQVSINGVSVNWYAAVMRKRVVINGCPLYD